VICPYCEHDNIPGADSCAECGQDLSSLDHPAAETPLEETIREASLERLHPTRPVMVAPDATVAEAIATLGEKRIGCVLVGEPDNLVGIFSERDALLRTAHRFGEVASQPISDLMTPNPVTLDIDAPIAFALNHMASGDYRHLPVTRDGSVVGVVSLRDVLRFLSEWYPDLIPAG
jgi:CBS domain-containing protein